MKRSDVNLYIREAIELFDTISFQLPPFAFWSPDHWQMVGEEVDEIRDNCLGWDVTDYGFGDFLEIGLLLFTIRNGNLIHKNRYQKGYAEKIMIVRENQITPCHYHWHKREDIINRGGGDLAIELFLASEDNSLSDKSFSVSVDGLRKKVAAGDTVVLTPGESICLEPYVFHTFYGKPGSGTVIVGEVSDVNDDKKDNCYLEKVGRFPKLVEDEPPIHYLCTEYPKVHRSG